MNASNTRLNFFNIPRPELEERRQRAGAITGLTVADDHIRCWKDPARTATSKHLQYMRGRV